MSEPVSALNGAVAAGHVSVADAGLIGMITLRGDLAAPALQAVCAELTGAGFPGRLGVSETAGKAICWMSPDEVLLMLPYATVAEALSRMAQALAGLHHLAVDVSDARAVIHLRGAAAREVLAKLTPADLRPDHFGPGIMRRSHLGQVAAAFRMLDDQTIEVICFRSVADYVFALLATSAKAGPVGYY